MAIINTGSFPAGLRPIARRWFGINYKQWPAEWSQIYETVPSDRLFEDYVGVSGFGLAKIKESGKSISYDSARQGFTARGTNLSMGLGFIVTYEELKDNQWGPAVVKKSKGLARSMNEAKEYLAALPLSRAATAGYTGADGATLLSSSHPNARDNSTWSNRLAVDSDLDELSLEQITIQIMSAADDAGLSVHIKPEAVIVTPNDVYNAHRILKSIKQSRTANNDINAMRDLGIFPKGAVVNRYFNTGHNGWFVTTDCPDGMIHQDREKIRFGEDNDFDTMNAKFFAFERYAFLWADPHGVYGSPGAA